MSQGATTAPEVPTVIIREPLSITPAPNDAHALSAAPATIGMSFLKPISEATSDFKYPAISSDFTISGKNEASMSNLPQEWIFLKRLGS